MSQSELLILVLAQLQNSHIPYMVTGSVVSSLQGEPRATHDIDVVVLLDRAAALHLPTLFSTDQFYLNPASVLDALDRQSMFNLIDMFSGNKVDFWLLTNSEYDQTRFARRIRIEALSIPEFYVSSPEDTMLSKLRWAKLAGGSEKQLTDVIHVLEMQFEQLDFDYLRLWIDRLSLQTEWQYVVARAEPY